MRNLSIRCITYQNKNKARWSCSTRYEIDHFARLWEEDEKKGKQKKKFASDILKGNRNILVLVLKPVLISCCLSGLFSCSLKLSWDLSFTIIFLKALSASALIDYTTIYLCTIVLTKHLHQIHPIPCPVFFFQTDICPSSADELCYVLFQIYLPYFPPSVVISTVGKLVSRCQNKHVDCFLDNLLFKRKKALLS